MSSVAGTFLQNIVRFEIKFATCVHSNEQMVAFSTSSIRTCFTLIRTTVKVACFPLPCVPLTFCCYRSLYVCCYGVTLCHCSVSCSTIFTRLYFYRFYLIPGWYLMYVSYWSKVMYEIFLSATSSLACSFCCCCFLFLFFLL